MNYSANYYDYIAYVKTLSRQKLPQTHPNYVYYEKHHILPKCAGGSDSEENLVLLTGREHFLAHYLLAKMYRNTPIANKLIFAFNSLSNGYNNGHRPGYYVNSRLYEASRKAYAKAVSDFFRGTSFGKGKPKHFSDVKKREQWKQNRRGDQGSQSIISIMKRTGWSKEQVRNWLSEKVKKTHTKERRELTAKNNSKYKSKPVICNETQEVFPSCTEAIAKYGYYVQTLLESGLQSKKGRCKGLSFSYREGYQYEPRKLEFS